MSGTALFLLVLTMIAATIAFNVSLASVWVFAGITFIAFIIVLFYDWLK